jgi:site-specific DNA-methyltransferase (adenine-specific)
MIELFNIDCMVKMAEYPDKYFDLAIVDPPYGIDRANNTVTISKVSTRKNSYVKRGDYGGKEWDKESPPKEYFIELFRISKHQIIWGANHFISKMPIDSSCWIIWDKVDALPTYASGEMAWTSFNSPMKIVALRHSGFKRGVNVGKESKIIYNVPFSGAMDIHPTQKPITLYKWLLKNYAKQGDKIIDTHLGSGSSAIAAYDFGCDFVGCEIDKDYYDAAVKRFNVHKMQQKLF